MLQGLLGLLSPMSCAACEEEATRLSTIGLCARCEAEVSSLPQWFRPPPRVRDAWALGPYDGPLGPAVRNAKFGPDHARMRSLGRRLGLAASARLPRVDAVVPVPVPWGRRLHRGFDQGQVLAREVAASLDLPVLPLLRRHAAEPLSRGADLADRVHSARSSFRAACEAPARVLLVDDVHTTGATAGACADELLGSGARKVYLLVVARRRSPEEQAEALKRRSQPARVSEFLDAVG